MPAGSWRFVCLGALVLACLTSGIRAEGNKPVEIANWNQCGGKGGDCSSMPGYTCKNAAYKGYVCKPGFTCTRKDDWYWQCIEGTPANSNTSSPMPDTPSSPKPDNSSSPAPSNVVMVEAWGQCGGKGGDCASKAGGKCQDAAYPGVLCPHGYFCDKQDVWYWQCVVIKNDIPSSPVTPSPKPETPASPKPETSPSPKPEIPTSPKPETPASPKPETPASPPPTSTTLMVDLWGQCGGKGGNCGTKPGYVCADASYPGVLCPHRSYCNRTDEWYWQCIEIVNNIPSSPVTPSPKPETPTSPKPETPASPKPETPASPKPEGPKTIDWQQCGGEGGDCKKSGYKCADAAYEGFSCTSGYSCKRQDNWYWQCKP